MLKKQFLLRKDTQAKSTASFQMKWVEVKTIDGRIRIKGFASTPQVDRYDDIVAPEAFANAMTQYMTNPVVLLGHNSDKVLGQVIEYNLSAAGLEITAELSNDIDNTFQNVMDKNLRGFSIGFICKSYNLSETNDREIRTITELDLIEISVVSTPANPSSLFTLAKSLKNLFSEMDKKEAEGEPQKDEITPPEEQKAEDEEKGKKPNKKEDDEDEDETEIAAAKKKSLEEEEAKKAAEENPKTEKEAPAGETPATPETVEVPAPDNSTPVEAGKETPEVPAPVGLTEDEVKSLIETAVREAVEPIATELAEMKKAQVVLETAQTELEGKTTAIETSHKELEADVLKIEIPAGGFSRKTTSQKSVVISDAFVLKSMGM